MLNLFLFVIFLTCIGIVGAWLAENPGNVTIHWFDYQIDTSFAFLLLAAFIFALVLAYIYTIIRGLMHIPRHLSTRKRLVAYEKGLLALTKSVAALAASDPESAGVHTLKAEKFLGRTPLTLLLSAQIAKSQGNDTKTHLLLTQMLEHEETEYLAAGSLSESLSKQNIPDALTLAQRAVAINSQGIAKVVSLHLRLGQWQQALLAVDTANRKGKLNRSENKRYKGLIFLEQGLQSAHEADTEQADVAARYALKYIPSFPPAIAFAAFRYVAHHLESKAIGLLTKQWKKTPDPLLAQTFRKIIAKFPKERQLKLARGFISYHSESRESHLLMAEIALSMRDWPTARKAAADTIALQETARPLAIMAEIEQAEHANSAAGHEWQIRASNAKPDAAWNCKHCSAPAGNWSAHCTHCGGFDTLEWGQRSLKFVN